MMELVRRLYLTIPLFLSLLIVLFGCSNNISNSDGQSTIDGYSITTQTITNEQLVFGIIFPMGDPAYEQITENAEVIAKKENIRLLVAAPEEANLEQQIRIMESMIRQKVNGIAISPVDAEALRPLIDEAVSNNIPVICFESDSPDSKRISFVGANNYDTGKKLGESINQLLNGNGMIIVGTGMADMLSLQERLSGLLDYLNTYTNIEVLNVNYNEGKIDTAIEMLERTIDDHPHFSAFLCLDSVSSSASILIWKASGSSRYVLSIGKTNESLTALQNGQIETIISQNEHMWGASIVEALIKAHNDQVLPTFIDMGIKEIQFEH